MPLAKIYYPHMLKLPSPEIVQFTDVTAARNYALTKESQANGPYPIFVGGMSSAPDIRFTTRAVGAILGQFETQTANQLVVRDYSAGTVDLIYRAGLKHGLRHPSADAQHIKASMATNSMLYWEGLNATQNEPATIRGVLLASGATPIVITGSSATADPSAYGTLYKLGPLFINGTEVFGHTSVRWENNCEVRSVLSGGESKPGFICIDQFAPVITITTLDVDQFTTALAADGGTSLTSVGIYLRAMSEAGYVASDAGTNHIYLSATAGLKVAERASGSPGETEITLHLRKGAAATVFAIDTTSAIPNSG